MRQEKGRGKDPGPKFKCLLCPLLAVEPWASDLTFLNVKSSSINQEKLVHSLGLGTQTHSRASSHPGWQRILHSFVCLDPE